MMRPFSQPPRKEKPTIISAAARPDKSKTDPALPQCPSLAAPEAVRPYSDLVGEPLTHPAGTRPPDYRWSRHGHQ